MSEQLCRWGILGAASIARKNWKAIRNSGNATVAAVASRTPDRARQFIAECQSHAPFDPPPAACGRYEDLLARADVDAVYVPLPTGIRKNWVIRAAEAGKHVLCEKPCGVDAGEVREMLAACRANRVQFMDGVMFMHSARLSRLREVLDDGQSVGEIRRITAQFSFHAPEGFLAQNIRAQHDLEPLGCLGDLGWYTIRLILWTLGYQMPERVTGRLLREHGGSGRPGVPLEFAAELLFADGVSAGFYCSFLAENQQWANISGSKGYLHVADFVLPWFGSELTFDVTNAAYRILGCDFNMESHSRRFTVAEYSNSFANSQEAHMIRRFSEIVLSGKLDPSWGEIALATQSVLDACLRSARDGGREVPVS
jgi:predicted dehydrogenase